MLMLYLFKVDVLDLGLNYPYSSDCVVIADTHEDRGRLLCKQFGAHNRSVVKHFVLLGARALTLAETRLLKTSVATADRVWLVTRIGSFRQNFTGRSLPRLYDEGSMYELLERNPELYDTTPLWDDQYMHSVWFSRSGSGATIVPAAA
jgi:hypothetical protein